MMNYEVDWGKVTHQDSVGYGARPPVRCPFRGKLSWFDTVTYRIKYGCSPDTQCHDYEGHWHFEGQRFHVMPYGLRKWPVSAEEVALYAPHNTEVSR